MSETVELIAVERGFYQGRMVEPGQKFTFVKLTQISKLPRWAQPAGMPLPEVTPWNGDTKPLDAQHVARAKAGRNY